MAAPPCLWDRRQRQPASCSAYTVHWQAVSVDTHHTQGTFEFTVKP
ncbi:MAG: copper resistance protein CopC [Steroidobacteraceae bacterium]